MKRYFVYNLSNRNRALYVGMTNELSRRIYEHKNGLVDGFTKMYKVHKLVHYESQPDFASATKRKTIKKLA